jgi:DNA (cytosine-5)-methyltransferase 1
MKVVELFAGVGGFRLGLERAGHQVVWANEWDKYACDIYDKNFGGSIDRRDITKVPASEIPKHDLICGGFPCQAFSVAGKRRGFDETRGTLFFDIARIAAHHKTPYLLLENVKGLLSHDGGRTFATIIRTLDELGYDCQWQVLNSKDFGVPQNRERVIIVGS